MFSQFKEYLWQELCAALGIMLLYSSLQLHVANRDLDLCRDNFAREKINGETLLGKIAGQNSKVDALGREHVVRERRLTLALQQASLESKYADAALTRVADAKAVTCADAMPAVNDILKELQQ